MAPSFPDIHSPGNPRWPWTFTSSATCIDLLLADFDDDAVQIQDRIDCVQEPRLPFDRLLQHGIIADVTGDAMMAIWISLPVAKQRLEACLAALEMEPAVERFNETSKLAAFPPESACTRAI